MLAQPQSVCPWQWRQTLRFHPPSFPNSQLFHSLNFPAKITLNKPCGSRSRNISSGSSSSNNLKLEEENSFFDEDGVVQDMDGYLNHLSLEYDSVWDTKPSWSVLSLIHFNFDLEKKKTEIPGIMKSQLINWI